MGLLKLKRALIGAGRTALLYSMRPLYYATLIFGLISLGLGLIFNLGWLSLGAIGFSIFCALAYGLEQAKWVQTGRLLFSGGLFGLITIGFLLVGTYSPLALFYSWPLLVLFLLIGPEIALLVGLAASLFMTLIFVLERFVNLYNPPVKLDVLSTNLLTLAAGIVLLGSMGTGLVYLSKRIITLQEAMRQQSAELAAILAQEAQTRSAYQTLGLAVAGTAGQLSSSSEEQAMGAAQQVSALAEVTSSMLELSQTAERIAERSKQVQQASSEVAHSAQLVAATTVQVSQSSERGQQSATLAATSSQTVRQAYQSLNARFNQLTESSERIQTILNLIESIADETHLLALNATIEAAGAGEHGERFGVVAQEVKNLADRARTANEQVRQITNEVEQALTAARVEANNGETLTEQALKRAEQSAQLINEFEGVARRAAEEASEITRLAGQMEGVAKEIGFATRLQQDASRRILDSLLTVKQAAETSAIGSSQVASGTTRLKELASSFN